MQVDPYRAAAHHNASFQDPAEFTVIFTGNVTLENLLPLVSMYLATIPPKGAEQPPPPQQQQQSSHAAEDAETATMAAASTKSTTGSVLQDAGGSTISSTSGASSSGASSSGGWPHAVQPPRGLPPTSIKPLPWSFPDTPVVEDVQVWKGGVQGLQANLSSEHQMNLYDHAHTSNMVLHGLCKRPCVPVCRSAYISLYIACVVLLDWTQTTFRLPNHLAYSHTCTAPPVTRVCYRCPWCRP